MIPQRLALPLLLALMLLCVDAQAAQEDIHLHLETHEGCPSRAEFIAQVEARTVKARWVDSPDKVRAFEVILNRRPSSAELSACLQFLKAQSSLLSDGAELTAFEGSNNVLVKPADNPAQRARENLVHVLFNHNDFVTIR